MNFEASEEELYAVYTWNCAMLLKRKSRALLCRSFNHWRKRFSDKTVTEINSATRNQSGNVSARATSGAKIDSSKLAAETNAALQKELEMLIEEQNELEAATNQIKASIRQIAKSQASQQATSKQQPSFSSRYSNNIRLSFL